nr:MAG TPA: hypothetical protein [Caudoviricetes sp.]
MVFSSFLTRPVVAKRTVAAAEKPSNGHGLQRLHRVRLPAWRSEKLNPFASLRRKPIKGFRTCQHRRRRTTK